MSRFFSDLDVPNQTPGKTDLPAHTRGVAKGEEWLARRGPEPGRSDPRAHRTARDSTSLNPDHREPIDPRMPHIPPV